MSKIKKILTLIFFVDKLKKYFYIEETIMKSKICSLVILLLISACVATPVKQPVCSGNLLKGCQPTLYFNLNSVYLTPDTKQNLDWTYEKLKRWPQKHVLIVGHADSFGYPDKNLVLSKMRALAAKEYLVNKGVDADRITVSFKGEMEPICSKPACQELNRRVEVKIHTPNFGFGS